MQNEAFSINSGTHLAILLYWLLRSDNNSRLQIDAIGFLMILFGLR